MTAMAIYGMICITAMAIYGMICIMAMAIYTGWSVLRSGHIWDDLYKGSVYIYIYIQGDSWGICITLGNDSMSDSKQKSSYEHGSDFERLRSYGHFLIPIHALVWTALTEPAGGLWLTACIASINFASWLAHITSAVHNRASACVAAAASFSKTSFKHRSIQIKGNFTKLTLHLYFKCIMYYAGLLFSSFHCQQSLPSIPSFKRS